MKERSVAVERRAYGHWAVRADDSERATSLHEFKAGAFAHTREVARQHRTELAIKNKDGTIAQRDRYWRDSLPRYHLEIRRGSAQHPDACARERNDCVLGACYWVVAKRTANIVVGSSWTDKSLIDSGASMPQAARTPEDRIRYYASRFPIRRDPQQLLKQMRLWVERMLPAFVFNIEL